MNLRLLENLNLGRCQLCGSFFETHDPKKGSSRVVKENVRKAVQQEKGLIFWNDELAKRKNRKRIRPTEDGTVYERRFVCPSCVTNVLAIQEERIYEAISEYKHAA
jgi:hypothetical protein